VVDSVSTELDNYYRDLCDKDQQTQTASAIGHKNDSTALVDLFLESVKTVERRERTDEPFYISKRKDPGSSEGLHVKRTIEFVGYLRDGSTRSVENEEALAFRYLDREIFPGRTKRAVRVSRPRKLDLLLANGGDQMPIFAELKIGSDKLAYSALVQLLMLAAEFQSPSQRERLRNHSKGYVTWPPGGPFADLYIIAHNASEGTYRECSIDATEKISEQLVADARFSRYIRRIAYLNAINSGAMRFEKRFAFGLGL
jgi:hypothetical protein